MASGRVGMGALALAARAWQAGTFDAPIVRHVRPEREKGASPSAPRGGSWDRRRAAV